MAQKPTLNKKVAQKVHAYLKLLKEPAMPILDRNNLLLLQVKRGEWFLILGIENYLENEVE